MNDTKLKFKMKDYIYIQALRLSKARDDPISTVVREGLRIFMEFNKENSFSNFNSYYRDTLFSREVHVRVPKNIINDIDDICEKNNLSRAKVINTILGYYLQSKDPEIDEYEYLWGNIVIEKGGTIYDPKMFRGSS